jgi:hypothetical protein
MEAASTSETSVNFYQTPRRNNPDDSHLQDSIVYDYGLYPCTEGTNYNGFQPTHWVISKSSSDVEND